MLGFFVFYIGCTKTGQGSAPPVPKVILSASPSSIIVGDSLKLDVNVENITGLSYISFEIFFDPDYLAVDMESGVFAYEEFSDENFGPVMWLEIIDDTLGVLSAVLGGDNINGEIFTDIIIEGLQPGTTEMKLYEINLLQEDGSTVSGLNYLVPKDVTITVTE